MKTDIFILCKMQNEKTFYWNFESSEKRKWIRIRRLRHNAIRLEIEAKLGAPSSYSTAIW